MSFSQVNVLILHSLNITVGSLYLKDDKKDEIQRLGLMEVSGCLSMDMTKVLIYRLVRDHVSTVTEAGCRILINMVLLRVASMMTVNGISVNIIPEYPIERTTFTTQEAINLSFSGVINFLVTRLPSVYTEHILEFPAILMNLNIRLLTCNIFEAKQEKARVTLPQAVMAAASYC